MRSSADVGRLNRANITKDRYDPPSSPFEPPTYRASLYDIDAPDHAKPTSAPQFRLEYRRSFGSERSSRLSNSATTFNEDYSPPPPPSTRYKRATLLARELRAMNASADVSSSPERYPQQHPRHEDWHSEPSLRMDEYSSSFNRFSYLAEDESELNVRPRSVRAATAARPSSSYKGHANHNNSFLKQELNRSFDSAYNNSREEEAIRGQLRSYDHTSHVVSPIRTRRSVSEKETSLGELLRERSKKRTQEQQIKEIPTTRDDDEIINQSDIDKLVVAALKLQEQGCFDEAHFLLQKVERFRKERKDKEAIGAARPRRASLVLEEARKNLQTAGPSRLEKSVSEEEYQDEEFESLSDIDEIKQQHSLLGGSFIQQQKEEEETVDLSMQQHEPPREKQVREDYNLASEYASSTRVVDNDDATQQPIVMIPVAHVEASVLEEERERRKREIRNKRKQEQQQQLPAASAEEEAEATTSAEIQTAPPEIVAEEKSNAVAETRRNNSHHSEEEQEVIKELTATLSKKFSLESTTTRQQHKQQQVERQQQQPVQTQAQPVQQEKADARSLNKTANEQPQRDVLLVDNKEATKQKMFNKQAGDISLNKTAEDVEIQQSLAVTFPDTAFEHLKLDPEEATKTLEELERKRRQEEMLNPTKSSRLPSVFGLDSPTKKKEQQELDLFGFAGYTAKQGYLMKWMENPRFTFYSGSYHKRYFILTGGVLLHLKSKDSKIPRGMIALDQCRVQISQCKGIHAEYCVTVQAPNRKYTLFPDSRKEAVEWAVAIEHNANVLARMREEEESRTRQLARMKLSESKMSQHSSTMLSNFDPKEIIGQDVTSDEFKDFSQLTQVPTGSSNSLQEGGDNTQQQQQPAQSSSSTGVNALGIGAYYDMLGVPANASTEAIRKAYHRLAKMFHPDKNTSIDTERFALINRAFHVVQDPETRERYNLGERVKHALRRGVLVKIHDEDDGDSWSAAFYIGPSFTVVYWQDAEFGPVLRPGYQFAELRFVQEIIAGEEDQDWTWARRSEAGKRCLVIKGQRLGHDHIRLELDTEESRDEVLDGLRHLRCEQSMLFVQKLEKWLADGNR